MTGSLDETAIAEQIRRDLRELALRDWVRSCLAKTYFSSPKLAKKAIRRAARQRRARLYVYPCRHCAGYHLTHRPPQ